MLALRTCAALALAVIVLQSHAQLPLAGRPAIQRFTPDVEIYPGAFAVAQDRAGVVYVGATEGLLSFDGGHWYLHGFENEDLVRSLAMATDGRLYVGGYDVFGYIDTPAAPDADIVELSARVADADADFADVWSVLTAPEGIFFVALNHVFVYSPTDDSLQTFRHEGRFGAIARVDGRVLLQYRGEGLRVFVGDGFEPIPDTAQLAEQLFHIVPLDSGGALTLGRDGRWFRIAGDRVEEFPVSADLPPSSEFNGAVPTSSGRIAMGTRNGVVWFLDPRTGEAASVPVTTDWIAGLIPSREGGLIVQSDLETLHLRWPSAQTALGPEDGLTGSIYKALDWKGRWYAIGSSGVLARPDPDSAFELLDWTEFEAWDLAPLDDGTALLCESYVLKRVDGEGVVESFPDIQYPRRVFASRFDEGLYYVGTEFGIAVLRAGEGGVLRVVKGTRDGADIVSSIEEIGPGDLLVGTESNNIQRVRFDDTRSSVIERSGFDTELDYGDWSTSEVTRIDGEVHAVTARGVWAWRNGGFEAADLRGLDALRREQSFLSLVQSPSGAIWAWDFNRLFRQGLGDRWLALDIQHLLRGALTSIEFGPDDRLMAGMIGGVLIHDTRAPASARGGLQVMMRSVAYQSGPAAERRILDLDQEAVHRLAPRAGYSIRFAFALPGLEGRQQVRYQARLRGIEEDFSTWDSIDHFTYYDLEPGSYAFEVRARDAVGQVTLMDPFEFEIVPRWYQTGWGRIGLGTAFAAALMLLVWGLMRARVWRLETDRRRLAGLVDERTEALEAANRQLKGIAEVDDLTGVANRRRLDVVLRRQLEECRRRHRTIAVALIDLDRFKPFNDQHGHLAGDRALRLVAETLRGVFSEEGQLVARFGGDEFVVVLPGVDRTRATELARNARDALDRCGPDLRFSIGIAVAGIGADVEPDTLIDAADQQMYLAKKAGQDGVEVRVLDGTDR